MGPVEGPGVRLAAPQGGICQVDDRDVQEGIVEMAVIVGVVEDVR